MTRMSGSCNAEATVVPHFAVDAFRGAIQQIRKGDVVRICWGVNMYREAEVLGSMAGHAEISRIKLVGDPSSEEYMPVECLERVPVKSRADMLSQSCEARNELLKQRLRSLDRPKDLMEVVSELAPMKTRAMRAATLSPAAAAEKSRRLELDILASTLETVSCVPAERRSPSPPRKAIFSLPALPRRSPRERPLNLPRGSLRNPFSTPAAALQAPSPATKPARKSTPHSVAAAAAARSSQIRARRGMQKSPRDQQPTAGMDTTTADGIDSLSAHSSPERRTPDTAQGPRRVRLVRPSRELLRRLRWDPGSGAPELGHEQAGTADSSTGSDSDSSPCSADGDKDGKSGTFRCPIAAFLPPAAASTAAAVGPGIESEQAGVNGGRPVRTVKPNRLLFPDSPLYTIGSSSSSSSSLSEAAHSTQSAGREPDKRKSAENKRRSRRGRRSHGANTSQHQGTPAPRRAVHASLPVTETSTSTASDSDGYASTGTAVTSRLDRFLTSAGDPQEGQDAPWPGILFDRTAVSTAGSGNGSADAAEGMRCEGEMVDDAALDLLVQTCAEGLSDMGCDAGESLEALLGDCQPG